MVASPKNSGAERLLAYQTDGAEQDATAAGQLKVKEWTTHRSPDRPVHNMESVFISISETTEERDNTRGKKDRETQSPKNRHLLPNISTDSADKITRVDSVEDLTLTADLMSYEEYVTNHDYFDELGAFFGRMQCGQMSGQVSQLLRKKQTEQTRTGASAVQPKPKPPQTSTLMSKIETTMNMTCGKRIAELIHEGKTIRDSDMPCGEKISEMFRIVTEEKKKEEEEESNTRSVYYSPIGKSQEAPPLPILYEQVVQALDELRYNEYMAIIKAHPKVLTHQSEKDNRRTVVQVLASQTMVVPENVVLVTITQGPNAVSLTDFDGDTPLHSVIKVLNSSNMLVLEILLKFHPDAASRQNEQGNLPLHLAAALGNEHAEKAVRMLLDVNPKGLTTQNKLGQIPLHLACTQGAGSTSCARAILKQHKLESVPMTKLDNEGNSPLHAAIKHGATRDVIACFYEDVNETSLNAYLQKDGIGDLPLHSALKTMTVDTRIILPLIRAAPFTAVCRNVYGYLPLHLATAASMSQDVVRALLKADMPIDLGNPMDGTIFEREHKFSWWHVTIECEDMYIDLLDEILSEASLSEIITLSQSVGPDGVKMVKDVAPPQLKALIREKLLFLDRYEIQSESFSKTNLTAFCAIDHHGASQDDSLPANVSALVYDGGFSEITKRGEGGATTKGYEVALAPSNDSEDGDETLVDLRCYGLEEDFYAEIDVRMKHALSGQYVEEILNTHKRRAENTQATHFCVAFERKSHTLADLMETEHVKGTEWLTTCQLLLRSVAQALKHLHQSGLVHGDLDPNRIGSFADGWKLTDIGGVTPLGSSISGPFRRYAPPESISGTGRASKRLVPKPCVASPAWDAFSFGEIMVQLFLKECPYLPMFKERDETAMKKLSLLKKMDVDIICWEVKCNSGDLAADLVSRLISPCPLSRLSSMAKILSHKYFHEKIRDPIPTNGVNNSSSKHAGNLQTPPTMAKTEEVDESAAEEVTGKLWPRPNMSQPITGELRVEPALNNNSKSRPIVSKEPNPAQASHETSSLMAEQLTPSKAHGATQSNIGPSSTSETVIEQSEEVILRMMASLNMSNEAYTEMAEITNPGGAQKTRTTTRETVLKSMVKENELESGRSRGITDGGAHESLGSHELRPTVQEKREDKPLAPSKPGRFSFLVSPEKAEKSKNQVPANEQHQRLSASKAAIASSSGRKSATSNGLARLGGFLFTPSPVKQDNSVVTRQCQSAQPLGERPKLGEVIMKSEMLKKIPFGRLESPGMTNTPKATSVYEVEESMAFPHANNDPDIESNSSRPLFFTPSADEKEDHFVASSIPDTSRRVVENQSAQPVGERPKLGEVIMKSEILKKIPFGRLEGIGVANSPQIKSANKKRSMVEESVAFYCGEKKEPDDAPNSSQPLFFTPSTGEEEDNNTGKGRSQVEETIAYGALTSTTMRDLVARFEIEQDEAKVDTLKTPSPRSNEEEEIGSSSSRRIFFTPTADEERFVATNEKRSEEPYYSSDKSARKGLNAMHVTASSVSKAWSKDSRDSMLNEEADAVLSGSGEADFILYSPSSEEPPLTLRPSEDTDIASLVRGMILYGVPSAISSSSSYDTDDWHILPNLSISPTGKNEEKTAYGNLKETSPSGGLPGVTESAEKQIQQKKDLHSNCVEYANSVKQHPPPVALEVRVLQHNSRLQAPPPPPPPPLKEKPQNMMVNPANSFSTSSTAQSTAPPLSPQTPKTERSRSRKKDRSARSARSTSSATPPPPAPPPPMTPPMKERSSSRKKDRSARSVRNTSSATPPPPAPPPPMTPPTKERSSSRMKGRSARSVRSMSSTSPPPPAPPPPPMTPPTKDRSSSQKKDRSARSVRSTSSATPPPPAPPPPSMTPPTKERSSSQKKDRSARSVRSMSSTSPPPPAPPPPPQPLMMKQMPPMSPQTPTKERASSRVKDHSARSVRSTNSATPAYAPGPTFCTDTASSTAADSPVVPEPTVPLESPTLDGVPPTKDIPDMMISKTHYDILQVSHTCTLKEVKDAYRKMALKFHPDRNGETGATEIFTYVTRAYEVLSDDMKRMGYDAELRLAQLKEEEPRLPPPPAPASPPQPLMKQMSQPRKGHSARAAKSATSSTAPPPPPPPVVKSAKSKSSSESKVSASLTLPPPPHSLSSPRPKSLLSLASDKVSAHAYSSDSRKALSITKAKRSKAIRDRRAIRSVPSEVTLKTHISESSVESTRPPKKRGKVSSKHRRVPSCEIEIEDHSLQENQGGVNNTSPSSPSLMEKNKSVAASPSGRSKKSTGRGTPKKSPSREADLCHVDCGASQETTDTKRSRGERYRAIAEQTKRSRSRGTPKKSPSREAVLSDIDCDASQGTTDTKRSRGERYRAIAEQTKRSRGRKTTRSRDPPSKPDP